MTLGGLENTRSVCKHEKPPKSCFHDKKQLILVEEGNHTSLEQLSCDGSVLGHTVKEDQHSTGIHWQPRWTVSKLERGDGNEH